MKRIPLPVAFAVLTIVLIAVGSACTTKALPNTPDGAVQALLGAARVRDWSTAFRYVANASNLNESDFIADLAGRDGSLRTYSALERFDTSILHQNDNHALVRAGLEYYSAVGKLTDTRDLKVVREGELWKVVWPVYQIPKVPPQVLPVNYLRWDVIQRGAEDDWGAENAAPPKVRITSMNAIERDGAVIVLGEIVNDDTVPGFISVQSSLIGKNGEVLGEESAFDKMAHVLLPKEISPFRIDFPKVRLADVKNVRMQPNSMLVSASADPVIGVLHQRLENDSMGRPALKGELVNQSGQLVNIPHVIATFYDSAGKVVWVSDGYVDHALRPLTPEPFAVAIRADLAKQVQSYRVIVNQFSLNRLGMGM